MAVLRTDPCIIGADKAFCGGIGRVSGVGITVGLAQFEKLYVDWSTVRRPPAGT